jgi:hypothetical protein
VNKPGLKRMAAETAERIQQADDEAHRAQVSFLAGEFPAYFQTRCDEARQRIDDEYRRITESASAGGDSQEGQ